MALMCLFLLLLVVLILGGDGVDSFAGKGRRPHRPGHDLFGLATTTPFCNLSLGTARNTANVMLHSQPTTAFQVTNPKPYTVPPTVFFMHLFAAIEPQHNADWPPTDNVHGRKVKARHVYLERPFVIARVGTGATAHLEPHAAELISWAGDAGADATMLRVPRGPKTLGFGIRMRCPRGTSLDYLVNLKLRFVEQLFFDDDDDEEHNTQRGRSYRVQLRLKKQCPHIPRHGTPKHVEGLQLDVQAVDDFNWIHVVQNGKVAGEFAAIRSVTADVKRQQEHNDNQRRPVPANKATSTFRIHLDRGSDKVALGEPQVMSIADPHSKKLGIVRVFPEVHGPLMAAFRGHIDLVEDAYVLTPDAPIELLVEYHCPSSGGKAYVSVHLPIVGQGHVTFTMLKDCGPLDQNAAPSKSPLCDDLVDTGVRGLEVMLPRTDATAEQRMMHDGRITRDFAPGCDQVLSIPSSQPFVEMLVWYTGDDGLEFGRPSVAAALGVASPIVLGPALRGGVLTNHAVPLAIAFHCTGQGPSRVTVMLPIVKQGCQDDDDDDDDKKSRKYASPFERLRVLRRDIMWSFDVHCESTSWQPAPALGGVGAAGLHIGTAKGGKDVLGNDVVWDGIPQPGYFGERLHEGYGHDGIITVPASVDTLTLYVVYDTDERGALPAAEIGPVTIKAHGSAMGRIADATLSGEVATATATSTMRLDNHASAKELTIHFDCHYDGIVAVTVELDVVLPGDGVERLGKILITVPKRCTGDELSIPSSRVDLRIGTTPGGSDVVAEGRVKPLFTWSQTHQMHVVCEDREPYSLFYAKYHTFGKPLVVGNPFAWVDDVQGTANVAVTVQQDAIVDEGNDPKDPLWQFEIGSTSRVLNVSYNCVFHGMVMVTLALPNPADDGDRIAEFSWQVYCPEEGKSATVCGRQHAHHDGDAEDQDGEHDDEYDDEGDNTDPHRAGPHDPSKHERGGGPGQKTPKTRHVIHVGTSPTLSDVVRDGLALSQYAMARGSGSSRHCPLRAHGVAVVPPSHAYRDFYISTPSDPPVIHDAASVHSFCPAVVPVAYGSNVTGAGRLLPGVPQQVRLMMPCAPGVTGIAPVTVTYSFRDSIPKHVSWVVYKACGDVDAVAPPRAAGTSWFHRLVMLFLGMGSLVFLFFIGRHMTLPSQYQRVSTEEPPVRREDMILTPDVALPAQGGVYYDSESD